MALSAVFFWLAYVGGVCAAIIYPVVGVLLYVLVYHLNPETQWWGAAVRALGLRTSFTVALAAGIGVLLRWPRFEHGARQFPLAITLTAVWCVLAVASLGWGVGITERGTFHAEKLIKVFLFILLLVRCVRAPAHYHAVVLTWIAGVLYLGYQAYGGIGIKMGGRLSGGLGGPDFAESSGMAVHLVATLPLIGAAFFMARTWFGRGFALVSGALTVNLLVLTRTRNALAGLPVMALACVMSLPRGYRIRGVVGVAIGSLLAWHLTDNAWWSRMQTVRDYDRDASATWRLTYWEAAWRMVQDYPFGVGLGNFHHFIQDYIPGLTIVRSAHNTYVACLAELGWLGLFVFCAALLATFRSLGRLRRMAHAFPPMMPIVAFGRKCNFHLGWHAVALRAGLAGYLACGMFTTRLYAEDLWLLVGLAAALQNVGLAVAAETQPLAEARIETALQPGMPPAPAAEVPWDVEPRGIPRGAP